MEQRPSSGVAPPLEGGELAVSSSLLSCKLERERGRRPRAQIGSGDSNSREADRGLYSSTGKLVATRSSLSRRRGCGEG
jgi:hypothetical protein